MAPAAYPQSWIPLDIREVGDDFNHHQGAGLSTSHNHTRTQCAQCNTHRNTTTHMYTEAIHVHTPHMYTHVKHMNTQYRNHMTYHYAYLHMHIKHMYTQPHRYTGHTKAHTYIYSHRCTHLYTQSRVHTYTFRCRHKHTHMHA